MNLLSKKIYCDAVATTPLDKKVAQEIRKTEKLFYNPSAIYTGGLSARKVLYTAREKVARALSVKSDEIIFTSGGTESNNLAIHGLVKKLIDSGYKPEEINMVTTPIEHSSVLEIFRYLSSLGVEVRFAKINDRGEILVRDLEKLIDSQTVMVSVMYVNNEVGTIEPLREISKIIKRERTKRQETQNKNPIYFHTDASQAPLSENIFAETLGVDLMTLDGHKIYGPKGVGALFVKNGVKISPIIFGGGQEGGLRPTTENLPAIAGFAKALEMAVANRKHFSEKLSRLKETFIKKVLEIHGSKINGDKNGAPHIVNVFIPGIDAELFVLKLEKHGILCSTKSSCMKGKEESYVIYAMTNDHDRSKSSLRFSFLRDAGKKDISLIAKTVCKVALSK